MPACDYCAHTRMSFMLSVCVCVFVRVCVCACVVWVWCGCVHVWCVLCVCVRILHYYIIIHVCTTVYNNVNKTKNYSSANIVWTEELTPIQIEDFNMTPGPKVAMPRSVKGIFFLLFTPALLELIVEQSNKYEKWTEMTVSELTAYMGFMLLMGIVKLPSLYDYWEK